MDVPDQVVRLRQLRQRFPSVVISHDRDTWTFTATWTGPDGQPGTLHAHELRDLLDALEGALNYDYSDYSENRERHQS